MQSPLFFLQIAIALLFGISGCTYPISQKLKVKAEPDLTYPVVAIDPLAHKGKTVIWGGIIVLLRSQPNRTILTVLETPLDRWGAPQDEMQNRGRFIARVPWYLDEEIYSEMMKVTLAGDIVGERTWPVD